MPFLTKKRRHVSIWRQSRAKWRLAWSMASRVVIVVTESAMNSQTMDKVT